MQNVIQSFGQSYIVSKKPGLLAEKLKHLTSFSSSKFAKGHRDVKSRLLRKCKKPTIMG